MSSDIELCRQVIRTFAPGIDTENLQYVNIGDSILLGDGKKYVCLALATNPDEMNRLQTGIRKQIMEQHRKETGRQK